MTLEEIKKLDAEEKARKEKQKETDLKRIEEIKEELNKLYEEKKEILSRYEEIVCDKDDCMRCEPDTICPVNYGEFERYRYI